MCRRGFNRRVDGKSSGDWKPIPIQESLIFANYEVIKYLNKSLFYIISLVEETLKINKNYIIEHVIIC